MRILYFFRSSLKFILASLSSQSSHSHKNEKEEKKEERERERETERDGERDGERRRERRAAEREKSGGDAQEHGYDGEDEPYAKRKRAEDSFGDDFRPRAATLHEQENDASSWQLSASSRSEEPEKVVEQNSDESCCDE